MYKKFLSITLLVSVAHALSASEIPVAEAENVEISEQAVPANLEVKEQAVDDASNLEVIVENTESTTNVETTENSVEIVEPVVVQEEAVEEVVTANTENIVVETAETNVGVVEPSAVQEEALEEVVTENTENTVVETAETNVEVVEPEVVQEEAVEEVVPAVAESAKQVSYDFVVTEKAEQLLNGLSAEAREDFNDFGVALGKDLLALPAVQAFINKHLEMYTAYTAFKGESPRISIDFFILGEDAINEIQSKLDETNAKFKATLSEEDQVKFEELRQDLPDFLTTALGFTLSQIRIRKFPTELIKLDKNQELLVNVRVD